MVDHHDWYVAIDIPLIIFFLYVILDKCITYYKLKYWNYVVLIKLEITSVQVQQILRVHPPLLLLLSLSLYGPDIPQ